MSAPDPNTNNAVDQSEADTSSIIAPATDPRASSSPSMTMFAPNSNTRTINQSEADTSIMITPSINPYTSASSVMMSAISPSMNNTVGQSDVDAGNVTTLSNPHASNGMMATPSFTTNRHANQSDADTGNTVTPLMYPQAATSETAASATAISAAAGEKPLVELNTAEYLGYLCQNGYTSPLNTHSFDELTALLRILEILAGNNLKETTEAQSNLDKILGEQRDLWRLIDSGRKKKFDIGAEYRRKCSFLDLKELRQLRGQLDEENQSFPGQLNAIIRELGGTVGASQRAELKQKADERIFINAFLVKSLQERIQQLRDDTGVTKLREEMGRAKAEVNEGMETAQEEKEKLEIPRYILERNIAILVRARGQMLIDIDFCKTLMVLRVPFKFFSLPRELRDKIYATLLTFASKTTIITTIPYTRRIRKTKEPAIYWDDAGQIDRVKLWTHPLFQASSQFRREAAECFYRTNDFGIGKSRFDIDFGRLILSKSFLSAIKTVSITLCNFGWGTKVFCSRICTLPGLRTLNIYTSWYKIMHPIARSDRLAVEAFKLLLIDHIAVPVTTGCYSLKQTHAFAKPYHRFERFMSEIESLHDARYQFAALMYIFRRRTQAFKLQSGEEEELGRIAELIATARHAIQYTNVANTDADAKLAKEQAAKASFQRTENNETIYPIESEILTSDVFHAEDMGHKRQFKFAKLNPALKIRVWDCPLMDDEMHVMRHDRQFQERVLDLFDPKTCAAELEAKLRPSSVSRLNGDGGAMIDGENFGGGNSNGRGEGAEGDDAGDNTENVERNGENIEGINDATSLLPTLMTTEQVQEKLDELMAMIGTIEEAALVHLPESVLPEI